MATKHRKTVKHTTPAKADSPRPTRFQDPSLWLSAVSVRVETVRKQHKAPCIHCGKRPELRRLKVTRGAGRHGVTELYCIDCGLHVVARLQTEAQRAYHFLLEGAVPDGGSIRIADALFEAVKAAHKRRKAARDQRRASQDATV